MIAASPGAGGRPLRAFAGLGLLLLAWLGWRAPQLSGQAGRLAAGLQLSPILDIAPPPLLRLAAAAAPKPLPPTPPRLQAVPWRPVPLQHPERVEVMPPPMLPPPSQPPPPVAGAAPSAPAAPPPSDSRAYTLADQAYRQLQAGERRQAAALFDAALAIEPGNFQWRNDRRALGRRWQVGGFALLRDGGPLPNAPGSGLPGFAASPVLGGGQLGASIAWLVDPLARRPLAIVARANVAADSAGVRQDTAQAAIGIRQALLPGVTLSAERLIALGDATRGDWTLRLAAGGQRGRLEAYGEAGILARGAVYGGAQASARVMRFGPATVNAGAWGSVQTDAGAPDVWRIDLGPSATAAWRGIRLQADWRQRVAGNAAPGSGPVLTVSAGF